MRRVAVTGLGLVSPLGGDVETSWRRLVAGESGAGPITHFDAGDLQCRIACQVPVGGDSGNFDIDEWLEPRDQRRFDPFIQFAAAAAGQAVRDSGWEPQTDQQRARTGVLIGSGIGGLTRIEQTVLSLAEKGPRRGVSPFFIPASLINLASGLVSIIHGFKGPNHAVVTACSSGAHAIGDAARLIALDDADVMVAGGAEAPINRIGVAGFIACRALSTRYNDTPQKASRPYDAGRDGFVMGEGAGAVVLEAMDHALARGAPIYAELRGYGLSGDAHHITAPAENGDGAYRCMQAALKCAGIGAHDISYINAHGTSTPLGDEIELRAVERLLDGRGGNVTMSSTKSATGHLLGAAGALEAIFSILALRDNIAPPTLNLENPSVETALDLAPLRARHREIDIVLSNSFGFGGTNASLIFAKPSP